MRSARQKNVAVEERDVVVPDTYRALALGLDPQVWADAMALAPMLDGADLGKAVNLVETVRGLGYLLQMGASELSSLGLSETECARVLALPDLSSRVLCVRSKPTDPSTRLELAKEIAYRSLRWDVVTLGVVAWNAASQRVADRVIATGTTDDAMLDPLEVLRVAISAPGAVSFALWIWQPAVVRVTVTASDRDNADRLRMMASALHLTFSDLLVISPSDRVSLAVLDQWA